VTHRILCLDEPYSPEPTPEDNETDEFELVVGRRQVGALTFLAMVVVAACSGGSYLAGKAIAAREDASVPMIRIEQPPTPAPVLEATIVPPAVLPAPAAPAEEAPIFASAVPNAIYIQVGAVEKGIAVVLAEGLRKHGLDAFVAPGPGDKALRVLIGPFRDAEAYQKARSTVDQIGLASFARRYQL